jgi:hypothetical protein
MMRLGLPEAYTTVREASHSGGYRVSYTKKTSMASDDFSAVLRNGVKELQGTQNSEHVWDVQHDTQEVLRGAAAVTLAQGVPAQKVLETMQRAYLEPLEDMITKQDADNPELAEALDGILREATAAVEEVRALAEAEAAWDNKKAQSQTRERSGCADLRDVFALARGEGIVLTPKGPQQIVCGLLPGLAASDASAADACAALVLANKETAWSNGREAFSKDWCVDERSFQARLGNPGGS